MEQQPILESRKVWRENAFSLIYRMFVVATAQTELDTDTKVANYIVPLKIALGCPSNHKLIIFGDGRVSYNYFNDGNKFDPRALQMASVVTSMFNQWGDQSFRSTFASTHNFDAATLRIISDQLGEPQEFYGLDQQLSQDGKDKTEVLRRIRRNSKGFKAAFARFSGIGTQKIFNYSSVAVSPVTQVNTGVLRSAGCVTTIGDEEYSLDRTLNPSSDLRCRNCSVSQFCQDRQKALNNALQIQDHGALDDELDYLQLLDGIAERLVQGKDNFILV